MAYSSQGSFKTEYFLGESVLDVLSKLDFKISNGQLKYRGKVIDESNFTDHLLAKLGSNHPSIPEYFQKYSAPGKTKELLQEFISKSKEVEEIDLSRVLFEDGLPHTYGQVKIFIDQKSSKASGVVYPSGKVDFWTADYIRNKLKNDLGDAVGQFNKTNLLTGQQGYFPGNPNQFFVGKDEIKYLNKWSAPSWVSCELPTYQVEKFTQFMKFIFCEEQDFKLGHAWIRQMVDARAGCVLILAGTPGFGKNFFVEKICMALVGPKNYTTAARGEAKGGKFHAGVDECKLRYYDELQLEGAMRNDIKSFMNDYSTIERKGIDLEGPKAMHASFIIANNNPDKVKLEADDRKFWAPRLPTMPLHEYFSQSWADEFVQELESDQALKSIYEMCGDVGAGIDTRFPPKTETFYNYCFNALPYIVKEAVKKLEAQPVITNQDLTKKSRYEPYEIRDLIKEYEVKSGRLLADFYDTGKGRYKLTRPGVPPDAGLIEL